MQLIGTDCGKISYTLTSGLMLLWKSMYLANLTGWLTDTRFLTKEVEYIKEKVLSLGYKDLKQISKTETNLHESETALDLFQFTGIINNKTLPYLLDQVKAFNNK
jgi:hypothetical protein